MRLQLSREREREEANGRCVEATWKSCACDCVLMVKRMAADVCIREKYALTHNDSAMFEFVSQLQWCFGCVARMCWREKKRRRLYR